jgi:RNA polymerase sigma factor (sigma-70 family)
LPPESPASAAALRLEGTGREEEILARVRREGAGAWEEFLEGFAGVLFRVVALFADSYDDRMDFFLYICDRLREDDMKRVRAFQHRAEAPCRFSTYLTVVAKNMAVDFLRSREGRYRPFSRVASMDETDRLLFEYHLRDGASMEETRSLLQGRHGIRLSLEEASRRTAVIATALSANQRWKLLARLASRRRTLSIDPVAEAAVHDDERGLPLPGGPGGDPEQPLREKEAREVLQEALAAVEPRQRLALTLRFRDALSREEVARTLAVSPSQAESLIREAVAAVRRRLTHSGIDRADLEQAGWSAFWSEA